MIKQSKKRLFATALTLMTVCALSAYAAAPRAKIQTPVVKATGKTAQTVLHNTASEGIKLEGDISLTKGNKLVTVSLRDTDVKQALRMVADQSGLNIVFHDSVKGNVTLDLVNVKLNDAFKMIMQATELSYFVEKNTLIVTSAEASKTLNISKQAMTSIPVKYGDASKIAEFLNKNVFAINKPGLSNNEIVVTNPTKNELLIFGTASDYAMAKKIVTKLDSKPVLTSYKVNHTTPKEMAASICETLFLVPATGSQSGGSGMDSAAAPVDSGSASSTGSSIGQSGIQSSTNLSSSSSATTSGSNSTTKMSIGGANVACNVANSIKGGNGLQSLVASSLMVAYYPQQGTISVNGGSPEQLSLIAEFIKDHDKKQPQAYVEVSVVELSEEGSKEFQNNWSIWSNFISMTFDTASGLVSNPIYGGLFWAGGGYDKVDSTGKVTQTVQKYHGDFTVQQAIKYLITNKKGRMVSNPKVVVTNGQKSLIDMSSDYVKTVRSEILVTSSGGTAGGTQKTVEIGNDNGMKIEMIPFISPDGYVTLNLKPQFSTEKDKFYYVGPSGEKDLGATLLQRRTIELNNVRIKDGDTLVIGGIMIEDEKKEVAKIPVLGDIPYVGVFFRNTTNNSSKSELVILVTPRIIAEEDDTLVNNTTTKKSNTL